MARRALLSVDRPPDVAADAAEAREDKAKRFSSLALEEAAFEPAALAALGSHANKKQTEQEWGKVCLKKNIKACLHALIGVFVLSVLRA